VIVGLGILIVFGAMFSALPFDALVEGNEGGFYKG